MASRKDGGHLPRHQYHRQLRRKAWKVLEELEKLYEEIQALDVNQLRELLKKS